MKWTEKWLAIIQITQKMSCLTLTWCCFVHINVEGMDDGFHWLKTWSHAAQTTSKCVLCDPISKICPRCVLGLFPAVVKAEHLRSGHSEWRFWKCNLLCFLLRPDKYDACFSRHLYVTGFDGRSFKTGDVLARSPVPCYFTLQLKQTQHFSFNFNFFFPWTLITLTRPSISYHNFSAGPA